jgi:hypothetical protein
MAKKEYSWNIYRLRGTPAQFIGNRGGAGRSERHQQGIEEFKITGPVMQKRLIAQRTK